MPRSIFFGSDIAGETREQQQHNQALNVMRQVSMVDSEAEHGFRRQKTDLCDGLTFYSHLHCQRCNTPAPLPWRLLYCLKR